MARVKLDLFRKPYVTPLARAAAQPTTTQTQRTLAVILSYLSEMEGEDATANEDTTSNSTTIGCAI